MFIIKGYLFYLPIVYAIVSLLIVTLYGKKRLIALVYCGWLLYGIGPVIVLVVAINLANMMDCASSPDPTMMHPPCVVLGQDLSPFYSQGWGWICVFAVGIGIWAIVIFTAIWGGIFLIKKKWFNRRQTNELAG